MTDGLLRTVIRGSTTTQAPSPAEVIVDLLLDAYPDAVVAYSFRKLRNGYAGSAVRIRRSSDNAEADVGFDGNGDFDTAAAATHIGGGSGFIVTWYDQSGDGCDVTQSTAANQPVYTASGITGHPSVTFDGSSDRMEFVVPSFPNVDFSLITVVLEDSSQAQNGLFDLGSNTQGVWLTESDVIQNDVWSETPSRQSVAQPSGWDGNPHVFESVRDTSDNQSVVVDGATLATASKTGFTTPTRIQMGMRGTGGFKGQVTEFVFWQADLSANRAAARTNINSYYSVF